MTGLNLTALKFLGSYEDQYHDLNIGAEQARDLVSDIVENSRAMVHVISARAKKPASLRAKLRRKKYLDPNQQVADLIGIRVITYYTDDVDQVVTQLKEHLVINTSESVDKRGQLGLRDFGYRSVHLIARLNSKQVETLGLEILRDRWFEIQVRSILEHAWAEIEHEIVYKSGIVYPEGTIRRFASLAGTMELLDNEFQSLRGQKSELIKQYSRNYLNQKGNGISFDVARLLGYLEFARPTGLSWRKASDNGMPFDTGLDVSCVNALKSVGLGTPRSLSLLLKSPRFRYAVTSFAALQGIATKNVSHLAVVVLAIVVKNAKMVQLHFPEIIFDPAIKQMVQNRTKRL